MTEPMKLTHHDDLCTDCGACEAHIPGLLARLSDGSGHIERREVTAAFHALRACKTMALEINDKDLWP